MIGYFIKKLIINHAIILLTTTDHHYLMLILLFLYLIVSVCTETFNITIHKNTEIQYALPQVTTVCNYIQFIVLNVTNINDNTIALDVNSVFLDFNTKCDIYLECNDLSQINITFYTLYDTEIFYEININYIESTIIPETPSNDFDNNCGPNATCTFVIIIVLLIGVPALGIVIAIIIMSCCPGAEITPPIPKEAPPPIPKINDENFISLEESK